MSYVLAAFGVTFVTLVAYGAALSARRRALRREVTVLGETPVDKRSTREV